MIKKTEEEFKNIDEGSAAPSENIVADGIDASKEFIAKLKLKNKVGE